MQTFTPYEYVKISAANAFGKDGLNWASRIEFTEQLLNETYIEQIKIAQAMAKEPMMAVKALNACRDAMNGKESGFLVNLDCTASGLQIMAALTGCKKTASRVNLINTGKRENVYDFMATQMKEFGIDVDAKTMKLPTMTTFYGSTEQPKSIFGEDTPELAAFYKVLQDNLGGAWEMLQTVQMQWDSQWESYGWDMPDNHRVHIPVMIKKDFKIEIEEFFKRTFTFRTTVNGTKNYSRELCANITHSVDGYVVREMVRKAKEQGWQIATIHDAFFALPSNINQMRMNFVEILADISKSDLLTNILRDLTGKNLKYAKKSDDLYLDILNAEYALS